LTVNLACVKIVVQVSLGIWRKR